MPSTTRTIRVCCGSDRFLGYATALVLLSVAFMSGCSHVQSPPPPDDSINAFIDRADLIARSGEGGSSLRGIEYSMEALDRSSPELAASVRKNYDEVMAADTVEERKAAAEKLLTQLRAGGPPVAP